MIRDRLYVLGSVVLTPHDLKSILKALQHYFNRRLYLGHFWSCSFLKSLKNVKRIPTFLRVLSEASFKLLSPILVHRL